MPNHSRTGLSFEDSVKKGFNRVKEDLNTKKEEIYDLKSIVVNLANEIEHLKEKNTILHDLIQTQTNMISMVTEKASQSASQNPLSSSGTSSIGNERVPRTAEQELVRVFKRNKPEIVKRKILELSGQGEFILYDIFNMLVYQQGLCGKTTFYRYIKELEIEGLVEVSLIDGKRTIRCTGSIDV